MKIICVSSHYQNDSLYRLAKLMLGDKIKNDLTARNREVMAIINEEEVNIKFMSYEQDIKQFQGLRPDILIFHTPPPQELIDFASAVSMTGGMVLTL